MSSKLVKQALVDYWGKRSDNFDWRTNECPLDLQSIENVCILHLDDKIGDALMISLLVDALDNARPDLDLIIGTTESFADYWLRHPALSEVVIFPASHRKGRSTFKRIVDCQRAGKRDRGKFDTIISFEAYAQPDHFALLRQLQARTTIGFNKLPFRLFDYSLDERRHGVMASSIATRAMSVMKVFDQDTEIADLRAHVSFKSAEWARVVRYWDNLPEGPRVLINSYGDSSERCLTETSVLRIVRQLQRAGHVGGILVSTPNLEQTGYGSVLENEAVRVIGPLESRFELFALVASADLVVSPDTAVGHVAAAFGKPQICLFARHGSVPTVWHPRNDRCIALRSTSGANVNDLDEGALSMAMSALIHETAHHECQFRDCGHAKKHP